MKIDHIAMYVKDLEIVKDFYINYFNARVNDMYHNPKTGLKTYFLYFDDGSRIEIMNRPDMLEKEKNLNQIGYIHIAFNVGSKKKVDELTNELKEARYKILSGPRTTGDGYYESCILGPENNQIEITA